jgi:hypothetical protein
MPRWRCVPEGNPFTFWLNAYLSSSHCRLLNHHHITHHTIDTVFCYIFTMMKRPNLLGIIALLILPLREVSSLSLESPASTCSLTALSSASSSSSSASLLSRRRALLSVAGGVLSASSAFFVPFVSPSAAATDNGSDTTSDTDTTSTSSSDYFPFESRDRKGNKNAVIREDYWYMMGKTPPRQLLGPLKGDDPAFNAFGSCESAVAGGGNPCTYISLKQRAPAYSKYASSILVGAQEYQQLGRILKQLKFRTAIAIAADTTTTTTASTDTDTDTASIMDALWQEAASYVVTEERTVPPPIVDAELKMVLFATAMTTSPNFPGPSRELLVARFYANEAHYAHATMANAISSSIVNTNSNTSNESNNARDIDTAWQAWQFGRDSWNSYFQAVSRSIVPKVGEPFPAIPVME